MSLPQTDGNVTVWFTVDDKEYEVQQFDINFEQEVDQKGEPQTVVRGGLMTLTFSQIVPESIYAWAMGHNVKKDGSVDFRNETSNPPLSIEFTNGQCINFTRSINSESGGLSTTLIISPAEIIINGITLDNHWVD